MGYNGHGVALTQLAGKMIAQLMAVEKSELTDHILINKSMRGVSSPLLTYLGVKGTLYSYRISDWLMDISG